MLNILAASTSNARHCMTSSCKLVCCKRNRMSGTPEILPDCTSACRHAGAKIERRADLGKATAQIARRNTKKTKKHKEIKIQKQKKNGNKTQSGTPEGRGGSVKIKSQGWIINRTLRGSFSAVSTPNFASKYSLESSRRDLHNALLCTVL